MARAAAVLALLVAIPADAHQADPRISTVLDAVTPGLPPGVVIQVRTSIAEELVAQNTTTTPLLILGEDDRPFLRITATGVEADFAKRDWYRSNSPFDSATIPLSAYPGAPARWRRVSTGDSWGWFDHRLHPAQLSVPGDPKRRTRLGDWQVSVEYGTTHAVVRGHLEVAPVLGAFAVTADPAPHGLVVSALAGRLPGLFLTDPGGLPVVVSGLDGKPFLRLDAHGVEVDEGSPSWAEDRKARGETAPVVTTRPRWRRLASTPTMTWLDTRLGFGADQPPDPSRTADLKRWQVPITVQGRPTALTGLIRWVAADSAGRAPQRAGSARAFAAVGVVMLAVAAAAAVSAVRRLRGRSPQDKSGETW